MRNSMRVIKVSFLSLLLASSVMATDVQPIRTEPTDTSVIKCLTRAVSFADYANVVSFVINDNLAILNGLGFGQDTANWPTLENFQNNLLRYRFQLDVPFNTTSLHMMTEWGFFRDSRIIVANDPDSCWKVFTYDCCNVVAPTDINSYVNVVNAILLRDAPLALDKSIARQLGLLPFRLSHISYGYQLIILDTWSDIIDGNTDSTLEQITEKEPQLSFLGEIRSPVVTSNDNDFLVTYFVWESDDKAVFRVVIRVSDSELTVESFTRLGAYGHDFIRCSSSY